MISTYPEKQKQNNRPLVSVIVPVYNVKDYIERCLDSLLAQTLQEIEIIIVDDGATDGTSVICDKYAAADERIRVIHKKNAGVSAARNDGIQEAKANYIMFVDGDDWVDPQFCEIPYSLALRNKADVVMFGFRAYNERKKRFVKSEYRYFDDRLEKKEAMMLIHDSMAQSTWNKLYDYRVFNDIRYPEQYIIDDFATTYRIINKAEVVICTNSILYNYVIERSGCCSSTRNIRYAKDWVAIWQKKRADLQEWGYDIQEYDLRNALGLLSKYGHIEGVTEPLEAMIDSFEGYPQSMDAKRKIMLYIYRKSKKIFELACKVSGKRI